MKKIVFLVLTLVFSGCGKVQRLDTAKMKEMMEQDEIRQISAADISAKVEELGEALSDSLSAELMATNTCNWETSELAKRIEKEYALKIRLLGMPDVGSNTTLLPKEKAILDAYAFNAENKQSSSANIQEIDNTTILYTSPIKKETGIAEKCFSDNTYYFAVWSLIFKKEQVIKRM